MKYKVGDIVKLRDDLEVNKFYGKTKLNEAMVNAIGKKAEIKEIFKYKNKDGYYAKFASRYGGNWCISDEMIEGLWEEYKPSEQVSKSEGKYKLIDILNKIANGELKEGTKVKWYDAEYNYTNGELVRMDDEGKIYFICEDICLAQLNYEGLELIEPNQFREDTKMIEPTDNTKIEELDGYELTTLSLFYKINEIIRYINKED